MADDEAEYKCEYQDVPEGEETLNWLKRPGKALVTYADGSTFEGTFNEERMKHGVGTYTWKKPAEEDGDEPVVKATYTGDYWNGKKQGVGKMTFPNGDIFHGQWKDNQMNGEGTYIYKATGDIFTGTFVDGVKVGSGAYQFGADSSVMKGNWVEGSITEGTWEFKDGSVYKGVFKNGKPYQNGTFTLPNGTTQKGEYVWTVADEEDEEAPPVITWKGASVVTV